MTEAEFAASLLVDRDTALPPRLALYRNSVIRSLVAALEDGFPVVRQLVGPEFFAEMARVFVYNHPPRSRTLMLYGAEFAPFLKAFGPVVHLPYLPEVARLEQALRESHHAADAIPMPPARLSDLTPADQLRFAPSVRLLRCDAPVLAIWRAHVGGDTADLAQDIIILRPAFDPIPHGLTRDKADLLQALMAGATLEAALAAAPPDLDLSAVFSWLLTANALI